MEATINVTGDDRAVNQLLARVTRSADELGVGFAVFRDEAPVVGGGPQNTEQFPDETEVERSARQAAEQRKRLEDRKAQAAREAKAR